MIGIVIKVENFGRMWWVKYDGELGVVFGDGEYMCYVFDKSKVVVEVCMFNIFGSVD